MSDRERLRRALLAIDAANSGDPHTLVVRGERRPKEQAHAELMSEWIPRLVPEPGEALQLAARAHHLQRWILPRSDYPDGRVGYHRWRNALRSHHAETVAPLLEDAGYGRELVARVQALVRKEGLGRGDPEVQALEDALCLVFLETQLVDLAERLDGDRLENALRKSLAKMSPAGIALAAELPLAPEHAALLQRLAGENTPKRAPSEARGAPDPRRTP